MSMQQAGGGLELLSQCGTPFFDRDSCVEGGVASLDMAAWEARLALARLSAESRVCMRPRGQSVGLEKIAVKAANAGCTGHQLCCLCRPRSVASRASWAWFWLESLDARAQKREAREGSAAAVC